MPRLKCPPAREFDRSSVHQDPVGCGGTGKRVKKVARRVKQPVTPIVETVAAEVIEQPAPVTVTEVEETRRVS